MGFNGSTGWAPLIIIARKKIIVAPIQLSERKRENELSNSPNVEKVGGHQSQGAKGKAIVRL